MAAGVFRITNRKSGIDYIGSSRNMRQARSRLYCLLRTLKHPNKALQADFLHFQEWNFSFSVILYCEPFELIRYRNFFRVGSVYNPIYVPPVKARKVRKSRTHLSKSHRVNISFAMLGEKRRPLSQVTKDKISLAKTKYYEIQGILQDQSDLL
jgi:hypothetical protein